MSKQNDLYSKKRGDLLLHGTRNYRSINSYSMKLIFSKYINLSNGNVQNSGPGQRRAQLVLFVVLYLEFYADVLLLEHLCPLRFPNMAISLDDWLFACN